MFSWFVFLHFEGGSYKARRINERVTHNHSCFRIENVITAGADQRLIAVRCLDNPKCTTSYKHQQRNYRQGLDGFKHMGLPRW